MSPLRVHKSVVVTFLEAAKATLEQFGARRMELSEHGAPTPPELTRAYNEVRRLRDYLHRCVQGYADQVALDIAPEDIALLVACCRRFVTLIDARLDNDLGAEERAALKSKQQVVAHWVVELVQKPMLELPTVRQTGPAGEGERLLRTRIQDKLYGDVRHRPKILPPSSGSVVLNGQRSLGDAVKDGNTPVDATLAAQAAAQAAVVAHGVAMDAAAASQAQAQAQAPHGANALAVPTSSVVVTATVVPVAPQIDQAVVAPILFDHRKMTDPRLRALAAMDLRSFVRALGAADYRLATVMLASVLEAAIVDHALTRRAELGVSGQPDGWDVPQLLLKALGEAASTRDRLLAVHLFAARNLLRPAVQVTSPTVVTVGSYEVLRDFVQRALHGLGYGLVAAAASDDDEEKVPPVEPPPPTTSLADYAAMVDPEE